MIDKRQFSWNQLFNKIPHPTECDPSSYTQWIEGLGGIICSFVINVISCVMAYDRGFNAPHSTTRFITLCTMVSGFVIGNWGVWKIGFRETIGGGSFHTLRLSIVLYTLTPVLVGVGNSWFPWNLEFLCIPLAVVSVLGGLSTIVAFNIRMGRFWKMIGLKMPLWQQYAMIIIVPLAIFFDPRPWLSRGADASCIWDLIEVPSPVYESGKVCVQWIELDDVRSWLTSTLCVITIWQVISITVLLARSIQIRKQSGQVSTIVVSGTDTEA